MSTKRGASNVGLMNVTDYAYASSNSSCMYNTILVNSNVCGNDNWLHNTTTSQWAITPDKYQTGYVNVVGTTGTVGLIHVSFSHGARPVLFLKSTVKITGGTGSESNPYTLSL